MYVGTEYLDVEELLTYTPRRVTERAFGGQIGDRCDDDGTPVVSWNRNLLLVSFLYSLCLYRGPLSRTSSVRGSPKKRVSAEGGVTDPTVVVDP